DHGRGHVLERGQHRHDVDAGLIIYIPERIGLIKKEMILCKHLGNIVMPKGRSGWEVLPSESC
ncbi:MAG: hypothetical protein ACK2U3_05930, partial [Anaerolineales bacterium]